MDTEVVRKIHKYLSDLAVMHSSSNCKNHGYSVYDKTDKNKCFSVQKYKWDSNDYYTFYLTDVDYRHSKFFGERLHERINITIHIPYDISTAQFRGRELLEIKKLEVKEGADLVGFFDRLNKQLKLQKINECVLIDILNGIGAE